MLPDELVTGATLDHVAVSVADLDVQIEFYRNGFGFQVEMRADFPAIDTKTALLLLGEGLRVELVSSAGSVPHPVATPIDGARTQSYFHVAIAVDNLESALDRVIAAGATAVSPPAAAMRPGVRYAYLLDPEHNLIELICHDG